MIIDWVCLNRILCRCTKKPKEIQSWMYRSKCKSLSVFTVLMISVYVGVWTNRTLPMFFCYWCVPVFVLETLWNAARLRSSQRSWWYFHSNGSQWLTLTSCVFLVDHWCNDSWVFFYFISFFFLVRATDHFRSVGKFGQSEWVDSILIPLWKISSFYKFWVLFC